MLDKPDFVGSYEVDDYVYFFFRETAVEYMNCGKTIYSRIARVCKRDTGGKNILLQNWATYLKVMINLIEAGLIIRIAFYHKTSLVLRSSIYIVEARFRFLPKLYAKGCVIQLKMFRKTM